jgi:AraC-like DNA-binding protein
MFGNNYVTVDNPNVLPTSDPATPMGKRIPVFSGKDNMDIALGDVQSDDIFLPHATIRNMRGSFHHNAAFINTRNEGSHLFASCFFLDGHVTTTVKGLDKGTLMRKNLQTIKYDPNNELIHWCPKHKSFNIAHLSIEPDYLLELLPENEDWSQVLREKVIKEHRIFPDIPPALTAAQHRALQSILDCPLTGTLGRLMIETSIIQLMVLLVQAQLMQNASPVQQKFSRRDREMAEALKCYLTDTFLDNHSINDLAKHFGTNTNKLMSLFKSTFGLSIFEYITDLKMDYAKILLLDEARFVVEVSRSIGYKNPNHFSAAFKRKFGISPSKLKYA